MPKAWWMLLDAMLVVASLYLGYWLFHRAGWETWVQVRFWQAALVLAPIVVLNGLFYGLYERQTFANRSWIVGRTLLTAGISLLLSYAIIHFLLYDVWSRRIAVTAMASYATFGIFGRLLASQAIRSVRPALLLVGASNASPCMRALFDDPAMRVYGAIHRLHELVSDARSDQSEHIRRICRRFDIREIVVDSRGCKNPQALRAALDCLSEGRRVTDAVTFFEKTLHRVPVDAITPEWLLYADLQTYRPEQATLKRILDVFIASVGLIISLLLTPFIALAIRLDSKGPVFYSQDRVGLNGRVFRLYKFRTMAADAEGAGARWSGKRDTRVTRIGRLLRRSRLDELPQLWNILRGHMSVVGPRPERPHFVSSLSDSIPFYAQRHLVKPGLTGWAQINFRYGNCVEDAKRKLEYDLYYIKHMSLELDLTVLARTVHAVLTGGS